MEKRNEGSEGRSETEEYEMISNPIVFHKFRNAVHVDTDVKENKVTETVQAVTCRTEGNGDKSVSKEVSDICSSSSVDEGFILNISSGTNTGDRVSAEEETVDAGLMKMHAEKAKCEETEKSPAKNTVLRSHLKRRYFDLPNDNWARCLNYGEDHPALVNSRLKKQMKVHFLSRNQQHIGKHCSQKIQCYICKDFGHLSCVKLPDTSPTKVSCYNCGQSGHLGSDCSKCPKAIPGSKPSALCYRCREKGHFARMCTLPRKHARRVHAEVRSLESSSAPILEPQSDANDGKGETQESLIINIVQ